MDYPISVEYEYTDNMYKARQILENLPDLFAADFEVSPRWTKQELKLIKLRYNAAKDFETKRVLNQQLTADGLSHPSLTVITHLSLGISDRKAYVIVCSNHAVRQLVCHFLTQTDKTQLWHNTTFDFGHIYHEVGKLPKNYIDTQLLAKAILNDANGFKNKTKLKELMAYAYGEWAISKDNFVLEEMWDKNMIKYCATDSCATYKLYQDILEDQKKWKI